MRTRCAETTRNAILIAARNLFARSSYDDVSLRLVATEAGIDAFLVSRHFGSKAGLFQAVLDSCKPVSDALFEGTPSEVGDRLAYFIVLEPRGFEIDALRIVLQSIGSPTARPLLRHCQSTAGYEALESRLGGGETARVRSRLLAALLVGLAACRELNPDFDLSETTRRSLCLEASHLCSRLLPGTGLS